MSKKYKASATVVMTLEVTVEFEDNEKRVLEDQAREAVLDHDDIPLQFLVSGDVEVEDLVYEEVT